MAKSKVVTKDIDHGFKRIIKELKVLENKPYIKVGFPEKKSSTNKKKKKSNATVLEVAIYLEFGTVYMPERSFIRASFDQNRKKYEKKNVELLNKIYSGRMTVSKALDVLGVTMIADIQDFIRKGISPASKRAIRQSGTTLIDSTQMINSITYEKVMDGKK